MSVNEFTLKSASADFALRQKNVFDQLYALESDRNKNQTSVPSEMDLDEEDNTHLSTSNPRTQRSITKRLRGKESIFKKPQHPVPRNFINKIPDFKKHPHKWTRYSLDDVKDEDMSDKSNTKAALSFLEELNQRKMSDDSFENDKVDLSRKIVFKKQTKPIETKQFIEGDLDTLKASFRSSKVVMPEYVVGQKVKKEKKKRDMTKGKELKLDHLLEED